MATGLFALLDDIAVLARTAAASLDDMAAGAAKASAKSAGVVVDDAAVTPQYVRSVSAARELSVVKRIALGSLKNKFFFIIPAAMILSTWVPWLLPVLLILGGAYLVFEGAEKVLPWLGFASHAHAADVSVAVKGREEEEERKLVAGAVRTDLILSTEIMLISLSNINADSWVVRLGTLAIVAVMMTVVVYGAVALLVRMDDLGLKLAMKDSPSVKKFGQGLVNAMPKVLNVVSIVGTVAMLWVGGHLLILSPHELGFDLVYDAIHAVTHAVEEAGSIVTWLVDTALSALVGLGVGLLIVGLLTLGKKLAKRG